MQDLRQLMLNGNRGIDAPSAEAINPRARQELKDSPRSRLRKHWKALAGLVVAAAVLAAFMLVTFRSRGAALTEKDKIVLADFTNTTGEAIFDGSLKEATRPYLEQSPFLNVLADSEVAGVLKKMDRPANQRLTKEVTREVCLRSNSKAYIAGSITNISGGYVVTLTAVSCSAAQEIASSQAEAAAKPEVLAALGRAGNELRRKLGESLPSLARFNRPLQDATTSSLEALQAFSEGVNAIPVDISEAIRHLQRAVELDPYFAGAWAKLGSLYRGSGQMNLGDQCLTKAYELRNRVGELDRLNIEYLYNIVTGDYERCAAISEEMVRLYPNNYLGFNYVGVNAFRIGDVEKAARMFAMAVQLAPERPGLCINLMLAYQQLGRYDEARLVYEMARQRNFDSDLLRTARFALAFLEGDRAEMQEQVKWGVGKPSVEDRLLADWAAAAAYYGRFGEARNIEARAQAIALRNGATERMIEYQAKSALREAEVGNFAMARELARKALESRPGRSVATTIALALAKAGDGAAAERVAGALEGKYHADPLLANHEMATVRALIELNKRKYDAAIALLQPGLQYDFAQGLSGLQPAYVRGLAYLGAKRGTEAAAEFQKLVSHPGVVEMSVTGALARLQLARAEQLSGNIEKARTHYQNFLALWKDADPDIPVFQQAKTEYAKLR